MVQVKSFAKINLALDVLEKDPSSYHVIQTILYEFLDLFDELIFEEIEEGIEIECDHPDVPLGEKNLAWRAAKLFLGKTQVKRGIKIKIKKNIPVQGGLGGASSNAAAVLKTLNWFFNLNFEKEELARFGAEIGMDIPFFIYGGTALATHFGEEITVLPSLPKIDFKWIDTGIKIDTKWGYQNLKLSQCGRNLAKTQRLLKALPAYRTGRQGIQKQNPPVIIRNLHNDFETLIFEKYPELKKTSQDLKRKGALKTLLAGSGGVLIYIPA